MVDNHYKTPEASLINTDLQTSKPSTLGKWLAIVGSLLLLALPVGLVMSVLSMINDFQEITLSGDPKAMAGHISQALVSTVQGLILCLPGALLLCITVTILKYKRRWTYWASWIATVFTFLLIPIGTIIAVIILFQLIGKKHQYYQHLNKTIAPNK